MPDDANNGKPRIHMAGRYVIASIIVSSCLLNSSCDWWRTRNYKFDKVSPNGTYRVKVNGSVKDEGDFAGHFTDQGELQILKGNEMIINTSWNYKDNWDPSFIDSNPIIDWVESNVLRMGTDISRQPFTNELTISNQTGEQLKYISINSHKNESFYAFDIAPGGSVTVRSSPGFDPSPIDKVSIGYSGETQSGKRFTGVLEQKQPENSIKLQITLNLKT
ncbi:MAG TPA: hypothetical protein VN696_13530 [Pyrinomonadaceae bacterium]|nr:hypothetical protein [Pyrinomonadaceae bacterium]